MPSNKEKDEPHHKDVDEHGLLTAPVKPPPTQHRYRQVVTESSLIVMNKDQIKALELKFMQADENGDDGLSEKEFIETFSKVLGRKTTKQLSHMFMKIDANSDGSVDWDEFVNFMLLENKGADENSEKVTFSRLHLSYQASQKSQRHRKMIDCIMVLHPYYITGGRDGTIRFWDLDTMEHVRTLSDQPGPDMSATSSIEDIPKDVKVNIGWITGMTYMHNSQRLAVCSMDRVITFYDCRTFERTGRIRDVGAHRHIHNAPLCIDAVNFNERKPNGALKVVWPEMLLVGDAGGNVLVYRFNQPDWHVCDRTKGLTCRHYDPRKTSLMWKHVSLTRILGLHDGWITKVKYVAPLRLMVTSSLDTTMKLTDIGKLDTVDSKMNTSHISSVKRETFSRHTKGVCSWAYSAKFKFMASCALERQVLIWEPYSRNVSITLDGFLHAVQEVAVNDDQSVLVAMCLNKSFCIYDINEAHSLKLVKTIEDNHCYRPENKFTAMCLDQARNRFIAASSHLQIYEGTVKKDNGPRTHKNSCVSALYNPNFHQVITADNEGNVIVWDADTGQSVFRFNTGCKITTMCFDHNKRRLFTGSVEGQLIAWNFSNGQRLTEFERVGSSPRRSETTGLIYILEEKDESQSKFVVSVGWDRRVVVYPDLARPLQSAIYVMPSKSAQAAAHLQGKVIGHMDDILCVALCRHKIVATGGYDGRICMWHFDSSQFNIVMTPPDYKHVPNIPGQHQPEGRAVEKLLWIHSKNILVSAGNDGYLRFWDTRHGRMLFKKEVEHNNENILALAANPDYSKLFTGDAAGRIKVWDITQLVDLREESDKKEDKAARLRRMRQTEPDYSIEDDDSDQEDSPLASPSSVSFSPANLNFKSQDEPAKLWKMLSPKSKKSKKKKITSYFGYDNLGLTNHIDEEEAQATVVPLKFWQAHDGGISNIDHVNGHDMILSSSMDGKVLLWTTDGLLVGMFQQFNPEGWWNLDDSSSWYGMRPQPVVEAEDSLTSAASVPGTPTPGDIDGDPDTSVLHEHRHKGLPRNKTEYTFEQLAGKEPVTAPHGMHILNSLSTRMERVISLEDSKDTRGKDGHMDGKAEEVEEEEDVFAFTRGNSLLRVGSAARGRRMATATLAQKHRESNNKNDLARKKNEDSDGEGDVPPTVERRCSLVESYLRHHHHATTGNEALDREVLLNPRSDEKTAALVAFAQEVGVPLPHTLQPKVEDKASNELKDDDLSFWTASNSSTHRRKITRLAANHKPYVRQRDRKKEKLQLKVVDVAYVPFAEG